MAVDVRADLTLNDRELAEKANVAEDMCRTWIADVSNMQAGRPTAGAIYDFFAGNEELEFAIQTRDEWCRLQKIYNDEMDRRVETSEEAAETRAEVAAELEAMREEHKEAARRIRATTYETPGVVATTTAAVSEGIAGVARTAEETTMGFFGRLRENAFGVFGLAQDQTTSERVIGFIRLALAAIAIYLVYIAAKGAIGGGVALGERSAERIKSTLLDPGFREGLGQLPMQ